MWQAEGRAQGQCPVEDGAPGDCLSRIQSRGESVFSRFVPAPVGTCSFSASTRSSCGSCSALLCFWCLTPSPTAQHCERVAVLSGEPWVTYLTVPLSKGGSCPRTFAPASLVSQSPHPPDAGLAHWCHSVRNVLRFSSSERLPTAPSRTYLVIHCTIYLPS